MQDESSEITCATRSTSCLRQVRPRVDGGGDGSDRGDDGGAGGGDGDGRET